MTAQETDLLARVSERIKWDKRLSKSNLRLTIWADYSVILRGSLANEGAKAMAVEMAEITVGVMSVVVEIAVIKDVRVVRPKVVPNLWSLKR